MTIDQKLNALEEMAVRKLETIAAARGGIHNYRDIINIVDNAVQAVNRAQRALYVAYDKLEQRD